MQRNRVIVQSELADDLPIDHRRSRPAPAGHPEPAPECLGRDGRRRRSAAATADQNRTGGRRSCARDACRTPASVWIARASDKLFDAFYTTKSDGMGIGLSVSRSIVERHHGRLWAEPNEGPGATFTFSIPRRPGRAIPKSYRRSPAEWRIAPERPSHDGQATHWCRSSMMTSRCASRCPTCCGSSALPPRRSRRPKRSSPPMSSARRSCLVLDVAMPGMSGPIFNRN